MLLVAFILDQDERIFFDRQRYHVINLSRSLSKVTVQNKNGLSLRVLLFFTSTEENLWNFDSAIRTNLSFSFGILTC